MPPATERAAARTRISLPAIAVHILTVIGLTALMIAASYVRAPLPFTPVPVTFQTLVVILGSALVGARRGAAAQGLFLGLGALGAPVFAGGAAGFAVMVGPTGGYLIGFMLAAAIVGRLLGGWPASLARVTLVMALGAAIILVCGFIYLMALGFSPGRAFTIGVTPFLLWDSVKVGMATLSYRLLVGKRG